MGILVFGKVVDGKGTSPTGGIRSLRISESKFLGKFPKDAGIPPLEIKNLTE